MTRRGLNALLAGAIVLSSSAARGSSLFDPALRFRQMPTEHFVIYFHQHEERIAQRLAAIAEETWRTLQPRFTITPPRRTRVVLADQTELWNGYATPVPRNTVVIYAAWPPGPDLAFDDWLRIAFTHEFTHIVHLDRSEGWARVVRGIFGRTEYAFPNLFLPRWQIEGLATYEESVITGEGRLHAGDFRAMVSEAAAHHRFEPLDRVNGGLTDWPAGGAVYAYGVGFHAYLADRFGPDKLATLADATARSLPYIGSRAFKSVYGRSLGTLWRDYEAAATTAAGSPVDEGVKRLTHRGFSVSGPRFDRFTCDTCPPSVVYSASDPDGFPGLYRVSTGGGEPSVRLTDRYLGSTTAIGRESLYFDQLERRRDVALYSDLYVLNRTTGKVRRLTSDLRLRDPDLSPDGTTIVCVQERTDRRDLVLIRVKTDPTYSPSLLVSLPDTYFGAPRWSPDGRFIAVERHRLGSMSDVVIVEAGTKNVQTVASDPNARVVTPAWRPDGAAIVAAVAPRDDTFNLWEFAIDGGGRRQLTHTTGGATWPDVSPAGTELSFVGYSADGYDIYTTAYGRRPAAPTTSAPPPVSVAATPRVADAAVETRASRPYEPISTLAPTSWTPIIEGDSRQWRLGAGAWGYDVLGYHGYSATATWRVSSPADAPAPARADPDWQLSYLYARWRPTFYAAASAQTSFFAAPATEAGTPTASTLVAHELTAGVVVPIRRVRWSHQASASLVHEIDEYTLPTQRLSRTRRAIRAAWLYSSARTYGYSISPEDGIGIGATAEVVRRGLGAFADADVLTVDGRAYLPGIAPHHVAAVRLAAGRSTGDLAAGRTFLLGGPSSNALAADFGRHVASLLRGFATDSFAGSRVAVVNADYRWPIVRPQRGAGTWPLFLHTVHAAAFVDIGHAWTRTFAARDVKYSAGTELSANVVGGYSIPFTATVGAAWGHDGSGLIRDHATVYFRVGRAF